MHIEKNVCDIFLGTLLGDPHKSNDTDNARHDFMEEGNKLMKPAMEYTLLEAN